MKKIFRYLTSALLACLMVFCFVACDPSGEVSAPPVLSPGDKPYLPTDEYGEEEEPPVADDTPADPGTPVDHVFEAEASEIGGSYCMASSEYVDFSFGGNVLVRNIAMSYKFDFTSDEAYKVTMEVGVTSAFSESDWVERNLTDMFDVVVNGREVTDEVKVPAADATQVRCGNVYACVQAVEVPVSLVEGANSVVFYPLENMYGLDYINIKTSAELGGWEESRLEDEGTEVSVALPTEDKEGRMTLSCATHGKSNSFTLPALQADGGYTLSEKDGKQWYSFDVNGKTYSFAADGDYELPEGAVLDEGPAPDPTDPDPSVPNIIDNGKRIFDTSAWTTFDNGTVKGAHPVKEDARLKFTDASRFDFFYVAQDTHIADKASNLDGKKDFYGQDYTWKVKMSSTGAFDMLLFATKKLPAIYGEVDGAGGVYLTFDGEKISVKYENYRLEITDTVAEGTVKTPLDGSEFEVAITANRLSDNYMRVGIAVDGQKVKFELKNSPEQTTADAAGNLIFYSTNMYGQRLCFVPADGTTIELSNVALPNKDYVEPQGTLPPAPEPDPDAPTAVVNGKEFFDPDNWTTFGRGSVAGSPPAYADNALTFTDAARFELFYVADGMHIGDLKKNLANTDFYGQEYTWDLSMSASGNFSMLLFANNNFPATETDAMDSTAAAGAYLTFADGKLTVCHMEYGKNQKVAQADISDVLNGETFKLSITIVRVADLSIKFKIAVNDTEAAFTLIEPSLVVTEGDEEITLTEVADNWVQFNSPKSMYGQRLCIVPQAGSSVSIYDLVLPDEA